MYPQRDAEHTAQRIRCRHCSYSCKKKNQRKMQAHMRKDHPDCAGSAIAEYAGPAKKHTVAGVRFAAAQAQT